MLFVNKNSTNKEKDLNFSYKESLKVLKKLFLQKNYHQALELANLIDQKFPYNEENLRFKAHTLCELKNFNDAIIVMNKLIDIKPNDLNLLKNQALIYE